VPSEYVVGNMNGTTNRNITTKTKFILYQDSLMYRLITENLGDLKPIQGFSVDSCIYRMSFPTKQATKYSNHVVSGFKCQGKYYVYDSEQTKVHQIDWRNLDILKSSMEKIYNRKLGDKHGYTSAIFARNELAL